MTRDFRSGRKKRFFSPSTFFLLYDASPLWIHFLRFLFSFPRGNKGKTHNSIMERLLRERRSRKRGRSEKVSILSPGLPRSPYPFPFLAHSWSIKHSGTEEKQREDEQKWEIKTLGSEKALSLWIYPTTIQCIEKPKSKNFFQYMRVPYHVQQAHG